MKRLRNACGLACALLLAACGGGSGGTAGPPGGGDLSSIAQERLVVQMDINDDAAPDYVVLDTSSSPYTIVEALEGTLGGDPIDVTASRAGEAIDVEISRALADHMAASFNAGVRSELDVKDVDGELRTLVVFE